MIGDARDDRSVPVRRPLNMSRIAWEYSARSDLIVVIRQGRGQRVVLAIEHTAKMKGAMMSNMFVVSNRV